MRINYCSSLLIISILIYLFKHTKQDSHPIFDYCIADTRTSQSLFINGAPCINPNLATSSHFTTSALSKPGNTRANKFGFNVTLTTITNLPGLNTMGLAVARVDLERNGLVPPHAHPRASEVTICLKGSILVGFVDTSNRLFAQQLRAGDSFVFPKGLIHFLFNYGSTEALLVSGLNSQNPGAQISSVSTFVSKPLIPNDILKKAYQITDQDVIRIRRNLGG